MRACDCCVYRAHSYYGLSFDLGYGLSSESLQLLCISNRCTIINSILSRVTDSVKIKKVSLVHPRLIEFLHSPHKQATRSKTTSSKTV